MNQKGSAQQKADTIATADSDGRFSVELDEGIYDVFVTAAGFYPHCEKVQLKHTERKKHEVKLKLSQFLPTLHLD